MSICLSYSIDLTNTYADREEAKKEENFEFSPDYEDEDDEEWEQDNDWNNEENEVEDVKDESAAYLEFLNEEASDDLLHADCPYH